MIDQHGRSLHKLRVQLLDECQYRCVYCMPVDAKFSPLKDLLSPDEFFSICDNLVTKFGVQELRLTGGEPLLHPQFAEIVQKLSSLNVKKLALTTNGELLEDYIEVLLESGCTHINVSIDSLQEKRFKKITRGGNLDVVLNALHKAKAAGLHLKVNMVVLKNINDDEILDFVAFAEETGIEVRFLEAMKIGVLNKNHDRVLVPASDMVNIIEAHYKLTRLPVAKDATAFSYQTLSHQKKSYARIGFIASETLPFCGSCSRLRLSAKGKLRSCLMSTYDVDLRGKALEEYPNLIADVIDQKPTNRIPAIEQAMVEIGG